MCFINIHQLIVISLYRKLQLLLELQDVTGITLLMSELQF
jgi:hypothetical protein